MENEKKMAKFETDLDNIKELLLDIKDELKGMNQTYIPRNEIMLMFKSRDEKIDELKNTQNSAKQMLPTWISVLVAFAALIYSFIK